MQIYIFLRPYDNVTSNGAEQLYTFCKTNEYCSSDLFDIQESVTKLSFYYNQNLLVGLDLTSNTGNTLSYGDNLSTQFSLPVICQMISSVL